jgi:hypothetical protein
MKKGPMSKTNTMPKCKREEKAFAQIQNTNLGPKPNPNRMKLIKQREGKESHKRAKLRKGLANNKCHNSSFGLATKARAHKGVGQK